MPKILVIEDELPMRQRILETLSYEGFEAICAENGRKGVHAAKTHLPDVIVCDVNMPGINGYEVLNALRDDPATTTIPFIFLTARAGMKDLREGMNRGADDYLTKPFTVEELLGVIQTQLKKHAAFSEQAAREIDDLSVDLSRTLPHELRTPLQGILSLSEYLTQSGPKIVREADEAKIVEVGAYLHQSAERLHRLIENYLLYANLKLSAHDEERKQQHALFHQETLHTHDVIAFFAAKIAKEAGRQEDLTLDLTEAAILIAPKSLHKILEEVLDNALKFSQPGTEVRVVTRLDEQHFTLCLSDQGHGMSREQISKIRAYTQFNRRQHEQQGSGLGLAIARLLTDMNNGEFTIDSVKDQGTTVTVNFPLSS